MVAARAKLSAVQDHAPAMYLPRGCEERGEVIAAVALLNRAINLPDRRSDAALDRDVAGYYHLIRARGELVRALAEPAQRERELRRANGVALRPAGGANMDGSDIARCMRAHLVELHWAIDGDDAIPGALYMPGHRWDQLDRIGVDPDVLR